MEFYSGRNKQHIIAINISKERNTCL